MMEGGKVRLPEVIVHELHAVAEERTLVVGIPTEGSLVQDTLEGDKRPLVDNLVEEECQPEIVAAGDLSVEVPFCKPSS